MLSLVNNVAADCTSKNEICIEPGGIREIGGIKVSKPCWKYQYVIDCKIDSKNDCNKIDINHCNLVNTECVNHINEGKKYCANTRHDYFCSQSVTYTEMRSELIPDLDDEISRKKLLCSSYCLDGNCYNAKKAKIEPNDEMANAIASLQMLVDVRNGLIDKNTLTFDIFKGNALHCTNKITNYTKCCSNSGWAKDIGLAKCRPEEILLAKEHKLGKCIYLGEVHGDSEIFGHSIIRKKQYCCYPNVLSKTIQIGARKQLGKDFGTAEYPNCSGLTLDDIQNIDFSKIDFTEFFNRDLAPRIKEYDIHHQQELIKRSMPKLGNGKSANSN